MRSVVFAVAPALLLASGCWTMQEVVLPGGPDSDADSDADSDSDPDPDTDAPPSGSLLWARRIGGGGDDRVSSVAVLPGGPVIAAGIATGPAWADGPSGPEIEVAPAADRSHVFVVAYDGEGQIAWGFPAFLAEEDGPCDVSVGVTSQGAVVLGISSGGGGTLFPGFAEAMEHVAPSAAGEDASVAILARISPTGDPVDRWILESDEYLFFEKLSLAADGTLVVPVHHHSEVILDDEDHGLEVPGGGGCSGFVLTMDASFAPAATFFAGSKHVKAVAGLGAGNLLAVGGFEGTTIFGTGEDAELYAAEGPMDGFAARYDGAWELDDVEIFTGGDIEIFRDAVAGPGGSAVLAGIHTLAGEIASYELPDGPGNEGGVLLRMNDGGGVAWLRRIYGVAEGSGATPTEVAPAPGGGVVTAGEIWGSGILEAGSAGQETFDTGDLKWAFVARYSDQGDLLWRRSVTSSVTGGAWIGGLDAAQGPGTAAGGKFDGTIVLGEGEPGETAITTLGGPGEEGNDGYLMLLAP